MIAVHLQNSFSVHISNFSSAAVGTAAPNLCSLSFLGLMTCNPAQAKSRPHTPTSSDGWDFESQSDGDAAVRHRWHYNRGTVVGFVVFVLVISAFAIPESAPPLTAMATMVYHFGERLHSHAQHHTYTAIAHLRGTAQQCVARPEPLFQSAISALRVEIRGEH